MKKWYSYIILLLVCIGFASCQDNGMVPEPQTDGRVSVHLQIALPGGDPAERGAQARDFTDGGTDDTTEGQKTIIADDVYVLVFQGNTFKGRVPITSVTDQSGNSNVKVLEGTFDATGLFGSSLKLVVLANLKQNEVNTTFSESISESDLYNSLIYSYDGTQTPWNTDETSSDYRRIPMWGATSAFTLSANQLTQSCDMHRAVAKLGFLINATDAKSEGRGIDGFTIKDISISGVMDKGYCVSQAAMSGDYYTAPYVPASARTQTVTYSNLNVDKSYKDRIYLPERLVGDNPLTIKVSYTYKGKFKTKEIPFEENVIRNYSYLYNITSVTPDDFDVTISYAVVEWKSETIDVPPFK